MALHNPESHMGWRSSSYRTALTCFVISGIVWIGGLVYRALIANELFVPGTLDFDPAILPAQESMLYQLISAASIVIIIAYVLTVSSAVAVLRTIPLRIKQHGWLLMAAILLFMFIPVEVFTAYLDIKFILLWEGTKDLIAQHGMDAFLAARTNLQATLSHRIGALSGLPVMAMFCYVTAVFILIWQPMRKDSGNEVNTGDISGANLEQTSPEAGADRSGTHAAEHGETQNAEHNH